MFAVTVNAQYSFDQCQYSQFIDITGGYCSEKGEFSNKGATPDPEFDNLCVSLKFKNGVWFSFIPTKSAVAINVFSTGGANGIRSPKILIFEDCDTYLDCSPGNTEDIDELVVDKLILGKTYFIMVESSVGGEGEFQLCIQDFTPVPSPESDCDEAVVLCDKSPFKVESLIGTGKDNNEVEPGSCIRAEFASSWYKWTCKESGTLTFVLTPNNNNQRITDDLDFAVYELPNGINDCDNKSILRCCSSGANGGPENFENWKACNGPTGLSEHDTDLEETPGCQYGDNNFVAALNMVAGKSYVLLICNFTRSKLGFGIEFGGTGTFAGPDADFDYVALEEFECDKTIKFTDKSSSVADDIVNYFWSFGDGAQPATSLSQGPHDVIYDSFGEKIVALTVESERGCLVTKLIPIYVNPCCADFTLSVDAETSDPKCHGDTDGVILGSGSEGNPPYKYSLDGVNFQTIPVFYNLPANQYNLYIQDKKGCVDTIVVDINEPEPLVANAGNDQYIDMTDVTSMNGSYNPPDYNVSQYWSPVYNMEDSSRFDTDVWPYKTTTYTLTVTQEGTGCTDQDEMTIHVRDIREVWIPNVFSPNGDGFNEGFTAYNVKAATGIERMRIYDRWGELMFEAKDIPIGDDKFGWDGRFKGQYVNSGVYVYVIDVKFIDNSIVPFSGDITVLR